MQNLVYQTTLDWWIFLMAGSMVMMLAMITLSWQSWHKARKNPVEALRYE
ncbi:MAG: hypothetical protein ACNS62_04590 [Candidatus Cyclobacteriaceae bacterium M3_2C_046]